MTRTRILLFAFAAGCARLEPADTTDKADADADADADSDTDTDTDSDTDADTDADSDTDTDADSDADTDTDTGQGTLAITDVAVGDLLVTEIFDNPNLIDDDLGEWFELHVAGQDAIDLLGLVVHNDGSTQTFTVSASFVAAPGDHVVLGVNADPATNGGVTVDIAYDVADFQLSNDDDEVILDDGTGRTLDDVRYVEVAPWPNTSGASKSLDPAFLATNDDGSNWCPGIAPFGAGELGTPGDPNPACTTLPVGSLVAGDLVITEVLRDPLVVDEDFGEWFELRNISGSNVDLDGLEVADLDGELFVVAGSLIVPGGTYVVLGVDADPALNGGAPVAYAWGVTMNLGNADDELVLGTGALVIDTIVWDGAWPSTPGAAMQLSDDFEDPASNDDPVNWCDAVDVFGAGDLGTPGVSNEPC